MALPEELQAPRPSRAIARDRKDGRPTVVHLPQSDGRGVSEAGGGHLDTGCRLGNDHDARARCSRDQAAGLDRPWPTLGTARIGGRPAHNSKPQVEGANQDSIRDTARVVIALQQLVLAEPWRAVAIHRRQVRAGSRRQVQPTSKLRNSRAGAEPRGHRPSRQFHGRQTRSSLVGVQRDILRGLRYGSDVRRQAERDKGHGDRQPRDQRRRTLREKRSEGDRKENSTHIEVAIGRGLPRGRDDQRNDQPVGEKHRKADEGLAGNRHASKKGDPSRQGRRNRNRGSWSSS